MCARPELIGVTLEPLDDRRCGSGRAVPANGSASAVVEGFQGHTYQFRARAHSTGGLVTPWGNASTMVSSTASLSHPFHGLYTLDGYGGIHADNSPPVAGSAYWGGWSIARAAPPPPGANTPPAGAGGARPRRPPPPLAPRP